MLQGPSCWVQLKSRLLESASSAKVYQLSMGGSLLWRVEPSPHSQRWREGCLWGSAFQDRNLGSDPLGLTFHPGSRH